MGNCEFHTNYVTWNAEKIALVLQSFHFSKEAQHISAGLKSFWLRSELRSFLEFIWPSTDHSFLLKEFWFFSKFQTFDINFQVPYCIPNVVLCLEAGKLKWKLLLGISFSLTGLNSPFSTSFNQLSTILLWKPSVFLVPGNTC